MVAIYIYDIVIYCNSYICLLYLCIDVVLTTETDTIMSVLVLYNCTCGRSLIIYAFIRSAHVPSATSATSHIPVPTTSFIPVSTTSSVSTSKTSSIKPVSTSTPVASTSVPAVPTPTIIPIKGKDG